MPYKCAEKALLRRSNDFYYGCSRINQDRELFTDVVVQCDFRYRPVFTHP